MQIEFDTEKREKTLAERGLDFARAYEVFSTLHIEQVDERHDYGEVRRIVFGCLDGVFVVMVYTVRGEARRVISMRKANEREINRYAQHLG